ncbi:MAG: hypothetical protein CSB55_01870 [Candidatus Cloacimonadota bacterium]|nr:MAG: hypothetical protein CSB55_01870 [Candidatus Cloacimonadota bacterium]
MRNEKIYLQRIQRFTEMLKEKRYYNSEELQISFIYDENEPIPFEKALKSEFKPLKLNEEWGKLWGCSWFKMKGKIPENWRGKKAAALINVSGEACVWINGVPDQGLTNKVHWDHGTGKNYYPLFDKANGNEEVNLLLEGGANGLFGSGQNDYRIVQAELVCVNDKIVELYYDFRVLHDLAENSEENTPRRNKIIRGLNDAVNAWHDGEGIEESLKFTKKLLLSQANNSDLTVYSIGHAHIDLAWLWPIRETKRKAGRTFSTALKLMDEYPEYKFGSSQPQMYQWVKENYPEIFNKIKEKVKENRWECQGAMWCEPDMNLAGGESLARQCLYGKKFFKDEFDVEIKNLWLPDVFGYSAALPQILKKSDVDVFMTQKISWNETNKFPYHTFMWQGIDGTEILTHFLPTNDYNLANNPGQLIKSQKRYAQNDVSDEFLNLYGIGDGGGGPSRMHVELGLRQQNLEGVPKFKFSLAQDFFDKLAEIPKERLPRWVGELYLELHRGTYTTQALMKKHNRYLEQYLRDAEFLSVLTGKNPKEELDKIWKDTLLNQFHDILPGSSINRVYKEANELSRQNLKKLANIEKNLIAEKFGLDESSNIFLVYNSNSRDRKIILKLPYPDGSYTVETNEEKQLRFADNGFLEAELNIPANNYLTFTITETDENGDKQNLPSKNNVLENDLIRAELNEKGEIISVYDKECKRETLAGPANKLLVWEDKPNNWGAWDINHFYRETRPWEPELISQELTHLSDLTAEITQKFKVLNSSVTQKISIEKDSKEIRIYNEVDWKEEHKMLRVQAKPDIFADTASFEIQYGTIQRKTHENTTWNSAKFEVCAHRFADLSRPDYGFALLNDCKYGHYVKGNTLDLCLLRSPKDTDKEADLHKHDFTFSYYPHKGSLNESDTLHKAHNLNSKIRTFRVKKRSSENSLFKIEDDSVKIETVKWSEDKKSVIIRLYETCGACKTVSVHIDKRFKSVGEVNILEREIKNQNFVFAEQKLTFDCSPFEIKTFKLEL